MNATTKKNVMIHSALLVALSLAGAQSTSAAKVPELLSGWEACGGVAKAGMNDCATKASPYSCAGMSKTDGAADSYVFLPKGLCAKIAKGVVLAATKEDLAKIKEKK